ncbi:hypothetical protein N7530_006096 [Penicillium desertorum]|uniref:Uncharacterized protein n=1 Tax=Penicillium desertorum TaxID=1303715 RepID=A0A9W9X1T2_9EURO|nr:hypothetical protein N7530_006096 [Penicillium desertorum]
MENTTDAMANVALAEPQRHKVYIVKYNLDRSRPEDAGAHLCYTRKNIEAHEVKEKGEGLVQIGTTTLTEKYPDGWDKVLRVVQENLKSETASLALVSRWTQEFARPALERAGLLEKMKSKEIEKNEKIEEKKKEEWKEKCSVRIRISGEDEK